MQRSENPDVWLEINNYDSSSEIWVTQDGGGLMPIYQGNIKRPLIYGAVQAPESGYVNRYECKGNEVGFYVRTSTNKFAKLLLQESVTKSIPYKNSFYKEKGRLLRYIFQSNGSRNLRAVPNIELEQILLENL